MNAEKIFLNGKVYTVEGESWDKSPVEAFAVAGGRIVAAGSKEQVLQFAGDDSEIIDLEGKTVLPGFIDSHVHTPGTAYNELFKIDLFGKFEKEPVVAEISRFVKEHPDDKVYFGSGFSMGMIQELDKDEIPAKWLDDICPDKPIILQSYDCHSFWLNHCAMETYGITPATTTLGNGSIHKDSKGNLKGVFTDVNDIGIPEAEYSKEQQLQALALFQKTMNAWGYTSIMCVTPTFSFDLWNYKEADAADMLTIRANLSVPFYSGELEENIAELCRMRDEIHSEKVKVTTAKLFIDGVLEGITAYLKESYDEAIGKGPDFNVPPNWEMDDLNEAFKRVAENGFQLHCHSIGDAATAMVLDGFEYIRDNCGEECEHDMRNVITHLEVVDEKDLDRFKELNVLASVQTFWHAKEPDFYEAVEVPCLGRERAEKVYPLRSFTKRGVKIIASGDYPVSFMNDPFMAIRAGVTRNLYSESYYGFDIDDIDDERFLLNADERVSVREMIEAYTINGAYELFREDEIGSIKEGKKADFIIVSEDPITCDPLKLDCIHVEKTYFDGKCVFEREN